MANTNLTRTKSSSSTLTKFTFSTWVKRCSFGTGNDHVLFGMWTDGDNRAYLTLNDADKLSYFERISASTSTSVRTNRLFRDSSAWYHIVLSADTTQATASDRIKLYVNGVQETSLDSTTYPTQNSNLQQQLNTGTQYVGNVDTGSFLNGSMSHIHYIDGTAYDATAFGEYDANGVWTIKTSPSVTYGTNGFFILKDGNSVTDQSGNSNNFTVAGGTLTNTEDNPSNVFANWNFLSSPSNGNIGDVTGSNGNTTTSYFAQYRSYPATLGFKSGKFYWEVKRKSTSNDCHLGLVSENLTPANQATWFGSTPNGWTYAGDGGDLYHNGSNPGSSAYATFTTNDIIGVAYDADNGKLFFSKNGTWQNSSDPANGTNPAFSSLDTSLFYFPGIVAGADTDTNFGNGYFGTTAVSSAGTNASGIGIFEYDVPTGYTALSTKGLNL